MYGYVYTKLQIYDMLVSLDMLFRPLSQTLQGALVAVGLVSLSLVVAWFAIGLNTTGRSEHSHGTSPILVTIAGKPQIDHPIIVTSDLSRPKQRRTHIGDRLHIFPQFLQRVVLAPRCQKWKEVPLVSELMQRLGDFNVFGDRENLGV